MPTEDAYCSRHLVLLNFCVVLLRPISPKLFLVPDFKFPASLSFSFFIFLLLNQKRKSVLLLVHMKQIEFHVSYVLVNDNAICSHAVMLMNNNTKVFNILSTNNAFYVSLSFICYNAVEPILGLKLQKRIIPCDCNQWIMSRPSAL